MTPRQLRLRNWVQWARLAMRCNKWPNDSGAGVLSCSDPAEIAAAETLTCMQTRRVAVLYFERWAISNAPFVVM